MRMHPFSVNGQDAQPRTRFAAHQRAACSCATCFGSSSAISTLTSKSARIGLDPFLVAELLDELEGDRRATTFWQRMKSDLLVQFLEFRVLGFLLQPMQRFVHAA